MNTIINHLSLIADAAEYLDRSTSAAWRIRTALTNAVIWQANSVLYAERTESENLHRERIKLSTMRCWARDCNTSSFVLDLTAKNIGKTLGLERNLDLHTEAVKIARGKCLKAHSAARFKEYYEQTMQSLEERYEQRRANVSLIEDLCQAHGWRLDGHMADMRGYDFAYDDEFVADEQLYDDNVCSDTLDKLSETIGNALEVMWGEIDAQLSGAITTTKITRLTGYRKAVETMMQVVGVDTEALAKRKAKLKALIDEQASAVEASAATLEAQMSAQLAEMTSPEVTPEPAAPRSTSLAYEQRMKDATEAAQHRAKTDAAAAKAKATRAAKRAAAIT